MLDRFGETMSLTRAERRQLVESAKEATDGRVPLLSGCIDARQMERLGIDWLMATSLLGYPPKKHEAAHYFRRLARASGLQRTCWAWPANGGICPSQACRDGWTGEA